MNELINQEIKTPDNAWLMIGSRRFDCARTKLPWWSNYSNARWRCSNPRNKNYYGKGIKFNLTLWQVGHLYYRDGADRMKRPSINRINSTGNYEFSNCNFLELSENSKSFLGKKHDQKFRNALIKYNKTRILSKTTKTKMSESAKRRGLCSDRGHNGRYLRKENI